MGLSVDTCAEHLDGDGITINISAIIATPDSSKAVQSLCSSNTETSTIATTQEAPMVIATHRSAIMWIGTKQHKHLS